MKKTIAFILSLIIAMSMAACGAGGAQEASGGQNTVSGSGAPSDSEPQITVANLSGEITGEITVSCYDTMQYKSFLEEAAKLFEEKYPGTKVNVETFSAMPEIKTSESGGKKVSAIMMEDDPQSRTDYLNKVNTSLMSGGGADVLAMDVLPFYKYAESGQIENLDAYMQADSDFNRADYRENILKAIAYKGGTWFLPLDYAFDYYAYDSTLLTESDAASFGTGSACTVGQLMDTASSVFDGVSKIFNVTGYTQMGNGSLFNRLLNESWPLFVDVENKKANFADGSFEELLNSVKEYEEKGYIPQGVTGRIDAGAIMKNSEQEPTARYYYKPNTNFSLVQQYNRNSGMKVRMFMAGAEAGIEDDDKVAGIASDKNGGVPFEFGQAYGINSNSGNKQTAWAFLKFLMSEDMQLSTSLSYSTTLPVNNAARAKKAELVFSGALMGGGKAAAEVNPENLESYSNAVEQLSDQINTYHIRDSVIDGMISTEAQYFFSGEKTAGEVAKTLQGKVDLYLNE